MSKESSEATEQIEKFFEIECKECGSKYVIVDFFAGYIHGSGGDAGYLRIECHDCGQKVDVDG